MTAPGQPPNGKRVSALLIELGFADIGALQMNAACGVMAEALEELKRAREALQMARQFAEAEAELRGVVDERYDPPAAVMIEKIDGVRALGVATSGYVAIAGEERLPGLTKGQTDERWQGVFDRMDSEWKADG